MEAAYAPYNWQESAESDTTIPIENVSGAYADGYDVQIAKRIAKALDMEPVAVKMEFGALVDALGNGTIDIICAGMSVTPERAQSADFTDSYIDDEVIVVVKKDSKYANATKLSDFTGATVLGQKDTFYDELIDEIPEVNHLTPVATVPLVVDGIENGTCDAITFSSMSLPNLLENYWPTVRASPIRATPTTPPSQRAKTTSSTNSIRSSAISRKKSACRSGRTAWIASRPNRRILHVR